MPNVVEFYKTIETKERQNKLLKEVHQLLEEANWPFLFEYMKLNADEIELTDEELKRFLEIIIEGLE